MCCVVFRGPVLYKQKTISYDNKQNKYMTISDTPSRAASRVSQCALNVKARESGDCILPDIAVFSDPLLLPLQSSWERRGRGEGRAGADEHFFRFSLCTFSNLPSILQNKNWNVLVVYSCLPSATVAKSSNMYSISFYVLCVSLFVCFYSTFYSEWGSPVAWQPLKAKGTTVTHKMAYHRWCRSSALCEAMDMPVGLVMPQVEH